MSVWQCLVYVCLKKCGVSANRARLDEGNLQSSVPSVEEVFHLDIANYL